jgi:hypothetical protein
MKGITMCSVSRIAIVLLLAAGSVATASAQAQPYGSIAPLTRAQVRADLVEWRDAGYEPVSNQYDYPENALRAGAIVAQRRAERAAGGQMQQPQYTQ